MFWGRVTGNSDNEDSRSRLANDLSVVNVPTASMFLASAMNILSEAMGFRLSAEADAGRRGDGAKIPMMSYGLVEYLEGLDLSGADVLEVGGGDSTAYWASRARSVVTLETNPKWARPDANPAVQLRVVGADKLAQSMSALEGEFGIIVIDAAGNRLSCARAAPAKLARGGFIILDNSDWYPNAAASLRAAGLIQIDFHDFRPARPYRGASSLFLSPEFRPVPREARLPLTPIGGKHVATNYWDEG